MVIICGFVIPCCFIIITCSTGTALGGIVYACSVYSVGSVFFFKKSSSAIFLL